MQKLLKSFFLVTSSFSLTVFGLLFFIHKILSFFLNPGGPADIGMYTIDYYPLTIILYCLFLYKFVVTPNNAIEYKVGYFGGIILLLCSLISFNAAGIDTLIVFAPLFAISLIIKIFKVGTKIKKFLQKFTIIYPIFSLLLSVYAILVIANFIERQQQIVYNVAVHKVANKYYGEPFENLVSELGDPTHMNKPSDLVYFYASELTYYTYCNVSHWNPKDTCQGLKVYVDTKNTVIAVAGTGPFIPVLQKTHLDSIALEKTNRSIDVFSSDYWLWRIDYLKWSASIFAGYFPPELHSDM